MTDTTTGPRFGFRQGIQILRVTRSLIASGDIVKGMSDEQVCDAILAAIMEDDPACFEAGFDWATLLERIIKMLPLILALFGL